MVRGLPGYILAVSDISVSFEYQGKNVLRRCVIGASVLL